MINYCQCDDCKARRSVIRSFLVLAIVAVILIACAMLTGCGPVTPPLVIGSAASYDGRDLNSGVIAEIPGGQLVTPHWRDRYNAMIALYGKRFAPPLRPDDGILPVAPGDHAAQYFIDNEHAVKFDLMNEWRKASAPSPASHPASTKQPLPDTAAALSKTC
jgi:hypothetical protein